MGAHARWSERNPEKTARLVCLYLSVFLRASRSNVVRNASVCGIKLGGTEHVRVASKLVHSPVAMAAPRAKCSSACSGRNQSESCNRAGGKVNESDLAATQNMLRTALAFMKEAQRATCRRGCVNVFAVHHAPVAPDDGMPRHDVDARPFTV